MFEKTKREHILPTYNNVVVESACSIGRTSSPGPGSAVKSVLSSKACHTKGVKEDGNTVDIYQKLSVSYSVIVSTVNSCNVIAKMCIVQMHYYSCEIFSCYGILSNL